MPTVWHSCCVSRQTRNQASPARELPLGLHFPALLPTVSIQLCGVGFTHYWKTKSLEHSPDWSWDGVQRVKQGRKISNKENRRAPRSSRFSRGADLVWRDQGMCLKNVVSIEISERVPFSVWFCLCWNRETAERTKWCLYRAVVCQTPAVLPVSSYGHPVRSGYDTFKWGNWSWESLRNLAQFTLCELCLSSSSVFIYTTCLSVISLYLFAFLASCLVQHLRLSKWSKGVWWW